MARRTRKTPKKASSKPKKGQTPPKAATAPETTTVLDYEVVIDGRTLEVTDRPMYEEAQLQGFILNNQLHGRVTKVEMTREYTPFNSDGDVLTKYKIYYK